MKQSVLFLALVATAVLTFSGITRAHARPQHDKMCCTVLVKGCLAEDVVVRLSPNPTPDGKVTLFNTQSEPLHIYVFDAEGTLLHQVELKAKSQHTIHNLKKGTYPFDVFKDEIAVQRGNIFSN